jgi:hypothetical protein
LNSPWTRKRAFWKFTAFSQSFASGSRHWR